MVHDPVSPFYYCQQYIQLVGRLAGNGAGEEGIGTETTGSNLRNSECVGMDRTGLVKAVMTEFCPLIRHSIWQKADSAQQVASLSFVIGHGSDYLWAFV